MSTMKRIVCLANSRKLNGRCVAGIEIANNRRVGWVRPVSAREHGEVSEYERQYKNGSDPRLLDIIDIPLIDARPGDFQKENWLLEPSEYWVKSGSLKWNDLADLDDPARPLWLNNYKTYNGRNDCVPLRLANTLTDSLRLVHVDRLVLSVFPPGEAFGNPKRRVQGRFTYNNSEYWLWVTDPNFEREYLDREDGEYKIGEAYLTISLGEPYNDSCYKLIASIMPPD